MPKISVLMSVYNAENFIDVAMESVLRQTIADFEFLIANDASTDGTWCRLDVLAKRDNRIRLWDMPANHGNVANQNFLFERSAGEYIAFMDADDISFPDRFEDQLEILEAGRADICGGWTINFGMGKDKLSMFFQSHQDIAMNLLFNCALAHPTIMMKRRVFDGVKFRPEATPAADYDYWVRALETNTIMCNLPRVLVGRRLHGGQISAARYEDQAEARRKASLLALNNQGVFPTSEEHRIHLNLFAPSRHLHSGTCAIPRKCEEVIATREWLKKLSSALGRDANCVQFLSKCWYMYCLRSASLGLRVYTAFRRYNPDEKGRYSLAKRAIVLFLSLFRVEYHSSLYNAFSMLRSEARRQSRLTRSEGANIDDLLRSLSSEQIS